MSFFESIFYMAWRGIAIGLIISAPMGPVGMLCIQRTLDKGRRAGLYTGIGAAISDLFYSLLTGFGLSFIEDFLEKNQNIIQLVGSFVLIGFGVYLFRKNPSKGLKKPVDENVSIEKSILGGFLFTFSNPLILFLIVGLFARFNFILPAQSSGVHIVQYITGFIFIFIGALIWWWFITFSIDKVRSHFNLRSMWLINKIIGSIIMLFAVVGIFTSVSALAKGEEIRCWNSVRGLGPFSPSGTSGRLTNKTSDTVFFLAPGGEAEWVEFRCKVKNHKTDKNWGFIITGHAAEEPARQIYIDIVSAETEFDGISTAPALEISLRGAGENKGTQYEGSSNTGNRKKSFKDDTDLLHKIKSGISGPDPTGSLNFYRIAVSEGAVSLYGGIHTPEKLLSAPISSDFKTDSIGFYLLPGSEISADEIKLTSKKNDMFMTSWDDMEALRLYLEASVDPMEGYRQTLDRSLEESLMRMGGDYRYAMVANGDGYDLLYLGGAKINSDSWKPGMLKASLRPSGIRDVWNVTWFDAMHRPISHEIKAQSDKNNTLTIRFPYQDSVIRLHPSTPGAESDR